MNKFNICKTLQGVAILQKKLGGKLVFWDRENGLNFVNDLTNLAKLMELVENAHSGGILRSLSAHSSVFYF